MKSNYLKRYLAMALCLFFIGGCAYIGTMRTATSHADTITVRKHQFYIVGTKIIDPDGKVFVPIGANVGSKPNNFDWAGGAAGQSDAALAWGWNTIRLNVYCTTAASYSRVNAKDGDSVLLADIAKIVDEYTAKKIVVMVECHDVKKNQNDAAVFWTDMANKYKSNPYVWFNYANEPEWSDNDTWITEQKQWLALIRSTGAENLFVADAMNAGNDAGWSSAKRIYDPAMGPALASGQCNVLLSLHNYGGMANSTDNVMRASAFQTYWSNVQKANLAMVVGEYGMNYQLAFQTQADGSVKVVATDGTSDPKKIANDGYNHNALGVYATDNYVKNYGIGSLVWHATFADNYLIASPPNGSLGKPNFYNILNDSRSGVRSGYAFTQVGSDLWNNGHNKPVAATFTGDYSQSNCSSVTSVNVPLPPAPIVLQPIGSTASATDSVQTQAAQFGVASHNADPKLINSFTTSTTAGNQKQSATGTTNPTPASATAATIPAGVTTVPITAASTKPAATDGRIAVPKPGAPTVKPKNLFSIAGKNVNAQQVGYAGGSSFGLILLMIVAFHFQDIMRSRRLRMLRHVLLKEQTAPNAPPLDATVLSQPVSPPSTIDSTLHQPGEVIRPQNRD